MARKVAQLIFAGALAALATLAGANNDLRTPQTPWRSLSPEQQRILGPVASDWDRLPGYQQQRLMSAAKKYPALQPIQKERFDQRLRDWTTMTPDQRKAARETFQGMRKLPPEKQHELRERWLDRHQEYPSGRPPGIPAAEGQRRYGEPQPQQPSYRGGGQRREEPPQGQGPRR